MAGFSATSKRSWVNAPAFADLAAFADFNQDRYAITAVPTAGIAAATPAELCVKRACSFSDWLAFSASSSTRSYTDAAGLHRSTIAVDQPRFDWLNGKRQLALNGPSTNGVRNNTFAGAVPGLIGGGGSFGSNGPSVFGGPGLNTQVLSTGVRNGREYLRFRVFGTSTSTYYVLGFDITPLAASDTNPVTSSAWLSLVSNNGAAFTNTVFQVRQVGGAAPNNETSIALTATPTRFQRSAVMATGATGAQGAFGVYLANGAAIDATFDIELPQIELQPFASPVIKTAGSAVTRAIETARMSPAIEAIMQRNATSIVVRGQNMLRNDGVLLGTPGGALLRSAGSPAASVYTAGAIGMGTGSASALPANAWAAALGFDAAGRSIVRNGAALASDANAAIADRSLAYFGRNTGGTVADGHYDFIGIAPARLADARLTALAVPA